MNDPLVILFVTVAWPYIVFICMLAYIHSDHNQKRYKQRSKKQEMWMAFFICLIAGPSIWIGALVIVVPWLIFEKIITVLKKNNWLTSEPEDRICP